MNFEVPVVVPEPGRVIEFSLRQGRFDFLVGFCRGLIFSSDHVVFVQGFRRVSDPGMTSCWAEPQDFGAHPAGKFIFDFVPEREWMTQLHPEGGQP